MFWNLLEGGLIGFGGWNIYFGDGGQHKYTQSLVHADFTDKFFKVKVIDISEARGPMRLLVFIDFTGSYAFSWDLKNARNKDLVSDGQKPEFFQNPVPGSNPGFDFNYSSLFRFPKSLPFF